MKYLAAAFLLLFSLSAQAFTLPNVGPIGHTVGGKVGLTYFIFLMDDGYCWVPFNVVNLFKFKPVPEMNDGEAFNDWFLRNKSELIDRDLYPDEQADCDELRVIYNLVPTAPVLTDPVIMDNTEASFTGSWITTTEYSGFYGADYKETTEAGAEAVYSVGVGDQNIEILVQYPSRGNRTIVDYKVINNGTEIGSVPVDQTRQGGQFNSIGSFTVSAGTLEIKEASNGNRVIADAIKVVPQ